MTTQTTRTSSLLAVMRAAANAGVAVLLWGEPGIGKSALIRALAEHDRTPCETVIGSLREPSDFAGLPIVSTNGVRMEAPSWAKRLCASEAGGWLFLDEITTAAPAVQKAMLGVVLDKQVGDLSLPNTVNIVAAANPADHAADGYDLAAPLANRFLHVDYAPDPQDWLTGVVSGFTMPAPDPLQPLNPTTRARIAGEVTAFLQTRGTDYLHHRPQDETKAGRAWPSRRSWTMLIDVLAQITTPDAAELAVLGLVGEGVGAEFMAWRDTMNLPSPRAMLDEPENIDWPSEPDRAWAACSAAIALASNGTRAEWTAGWKVLASATEHDLASVAAACGRALMASRPNGARPPAAVRSMQQAWQDAGLIPAAPEPATAQA